MKRVFLAVACGAALTCLGPVHLDAQTKKPDPVKKDDVKKDEPGKKDDGAKKTGGVEVYKGKRGYRYRIVDAAGKTIAMPTTNLSWETKEAVLKAINEVRETLNTAKPTEVKE